MDFDMEMKAVGRDRPGRRLMESENVREGHLPEIVEANENFPKDFGEIAQLGR